MREKSGSSKSHEREKFWRKVIAGQPQSGLSVAAWCGKHGVSQSAPLSGKRSAFPGRLQFSGD